MDSQANGYGRGCVSCCGAGGGGPCLAAPLGAPLSWPRILCSSVGFSDVTHRCDEAPAHTGCEWVAPLTTAVCPWSL